MSGERICAKCGARVMLGLCGYTHADGPDKHTPTPVRRVDASAPMFGHVSRGTKRPSGDAALFTKGDGR